MVEFDADIRRCHHKPHVWKPSSQASLVNPMCLESFRKRDTRQNVGFKAKWLFFKHYMLMYEKKKAKRRPYTAVHHSSDKFIGIR